MVQDINSTLRGIRTTVLGVTMLFALLELALGAAILHYTSQLPKELSTNFPPYAPLTIAVAVLTLITIPIMFLFSISRKGAFVNMNAVELGWTAVLWILWLSTGAYAAQQLSLVPDCSFFQGSSFEAVCQETQAVTAFGFLAWILLIFYNTFFLILVIRQQMRGVPDVWTGYVNETDFGAQASQPAYPAAQMTNANPGYVPQTQYPPAPQPQPAQVPVVNTPQPMSAYPQV